MATTDPQVPAGYSIRTLNGRSGVFFTMHVGDELREIALMARHHFGRYLETNDDGESVWKSSDEMVLNVGFVYQFRPIPDSELPADMTRHHTHFNTDTRKWELPIIASEVHRHHEANHDSDVAAAVAAICECRIDLLHRKAMLANLNPDQMARANVAYTGLDDCIDEIVGANAEPAIERAWLKSLGEIRHTGDDNPEAHYVGRAHDFAAAYLAHIADKTTGQLTAHRYQYHLCLIDELGKDADRTGDARCLPRGVKIVKRKSTPADATEVTAAQVFNKLRGLIVPSEGQPKPAA